MQKHLAGAAALALFAGAAQAGGLDRSGQGIGIIFEDGNYAELNFGRTSPDVTGTGSGITAFGLPAGTGYGNVAQSFTSLGGGVTFEVSPRTSAAFIVEEPFGSDIVYPGGPTAFATTELGGTEAIADTRSYTAILRHRFNENFSIHGGLRYQTAEGDITLSGLAYGPPAPIPGVAPFTVNRYSVELEKDGATGFLLGAAYEMPEIALRVALTYNSAITHKMRTTETSPADPYFNGTSTTDVETPQSVNLDFQTGIAEDTLLFGSVRWAEWSEFKINPALFTSVFPGGLVDLEDSVTWNLGVARRFSEQWAGSVSYTFEKPSSDDLVSPLAPTNGLDAITLAAIYNPTEQVRITTGIRYSMIGDARPETGTPDQDRASFTDNSAVSIGVRVGFRF